MNPTHKLTLKQDILVSMMRGIYWVFSGWIGPNHPYHRQVADLLDTADRITEDYPAIIARHIRRVDKPAQALVLQCLENLEIEAKEIDEGLYSCAHCGDLFELADLICHYDDGAEIRYCHVCEEIIN